MSSGGSIKPIDTTSVHRLHSGQVILDLAQALKELVENALDSGASSIEVRLRDSGLGSIEVVDNGSGIAEADWAGIGLKHHTSKLPDLALLPSVQTFGFRGEALSALCALCDEVGVVTSTKGTEPMGAVIRLARDGRVVDDKGRVARPRGTTITLTGLFGHLPVRRKEFERNAKRELSKALTLLTAYALVPSAIPTNPTLGAATGVRLRVESYTGGVGSKAGKRNTLLANDGRGDLRSAVMGVWGTKALDGVQDVRLEFAVPLDRMSRVGGMVGGEPKNKTKGKGKAEDVDVNGEDDEGVEQDGQGGEGAADAVTAPSLDVTVTGLVSSASWGMGRSSADRQYFYINGRPADVRPLQRALNEVYKSFNTHQVPLAVLDFTIPRESVDINVSPDKRTIMLHSEANLIAAFRTALEHMFAPSRSTFAVGGATQTVRGLKMTQTTLALGVKRKEAAAEVGDDAVGEDDAAEDLEEGDGRLAEEGVDGSGGVMAEDKETQEASSETFAGISRRESRTEVPAFGETSGEPQEAGPSRSSRTRGANTAPVMLLDEDEEDEAGDDTDIARDGLNREDQVDSDGETEIEEDSMPSRISSASRSASARSNTRTASALPSTPATQTPITVRKGPVFTRRSHTLSTVGAAWSPERRGEAGAGAGVARTASAGASTGREARKSLRDRLAVYSQAPREGNGEPEVIVLEDDGEDEDEAEDNDEGGVGTDEVLRATDARRSGQTAVRARASRDAEIAEHVCAHDHDMADPASPSSSRASSPAVAQALGPADVVLTHSDDDDIEPIPDPSTGPAAGRSFRDEILSAGPTGSMTVAFDMSGARRRVKRRRLADARDAGDASVNESLRRAAVAADAGIENRDLASAEQALARVIEKEDFGRMEVVGQFNKGFIIARLRKGAGETHTDDLFIVDQHASDEKFNFETLQRETVIRGQVLIKPRALQLTAADEITAIENLDVLRANGFGVQVDEDKPPGRGERVQLVAMPVSKETVFDYRDLEQLLHLLSDSAHSGANGTGTAGGVVRCTKARAMFAMRACRKSVMIGKSLTRPQMGQMLRNMGTIEQPWNCPHGRPTMRHLTTIDARKRGRGGVGRVDWGKWAEQAKEADEEDEKEEVEVEEDGMQVDVEE